MPDIWPILQALKPETWWCGYWAGRTGWTKHYDHLLDHDYCAGCGAGCAAKLIDDSYKRGD